jgi:hypothetical protein
MVFEMAELRDCKSVEIMVATKAQMLELILVAR